MTPLLMRMMTSGPVDLDDACVVEATTKNHTPANRQLACDGRSTVVDRAKNERMERSRKCHSQAYEMVERALPIARVWCGDELDSEALDESRHLGEGQEENPYACSRCCDERIACL